jgi:hypothetical protein
VKNSGLCAVLCSYLFAISVILCSAQPQKTPATPATDFRRFTRTQLQDCYNDKTLCGASSEWDITQELIDRLPRFSTNTLVACFANWKICGAMDSSATGWPLSDEIAKRGNPRALLERYWTEQNSATRTGIIHVAYHFRSPQIAAFMRRVLTENKAEAEELYWPAFYLAKRCDPDGLRWLSSRNGRDLGCIQFTGTVKVFGKCNYRPAIPYLVENSMHDACLNIVGDAEESLEMLYPNHPKHFLSLTTEQNYYCSRAIKEGFKVICEQN